MRRAGHATRSRLLAAARREFAEHGPAGARINRIAAEAHASKDRLYAYFPSKEELFGEVIRQWLLELEAAAQPSPDDMPGYVGRLFDHFVEHPRDGRLAAWAQLEAEQHLLGPDFDILGSAVEAVREGQRGGTVDRAWAPRDLVLLLIGIARGMSVPGWSHPPSGAGRQPTVDRRRAAAVEAARRLITAAP
ncbi:TetR/AcrR family transcriptional regulator [Phaeacidiphilus oryzae]|uniref:TetR/AcrR family transcriptional regulator n=1 Tax=Phaeacidiphilus oryzae TaxID=348818 RepID=UPI0005628C9F|nr:TetR family transcriptional regulator [Phaeacidiphilus oryzae]